MKKIMHSARRAEPASTPSSSPSPSPWPVLNAKKKAHIHKVSRRIAHDIKAPIRKIHQLTELLHMDYAPDLDDEARLYLRSLMELSAELDGLTMAVMDYVKCFSAEHCFEPVNISKSIQECLSTQASRPDGAAICISDDLPTLIAAPALMTSLFSHMLQNAIIFRDQSRALEVSISHTMSCAHTDIIIADNGIGISGEGADRIYEPLVRLQDKCNFNGPGMGLAMCKLICDIHGWSISHRPNTPRGTIFTIAIPNTALC